MAPKRKRKPFTTEWIKFPTGWIEALRNANASAYRLALVILAESFKREVLGGDVVLSAAVTGMTHCARRRATQELVDLGLIVVEQAGKRAPTVIHICRERKTVREGANLSRSG